MPFSEQTVFLHASMSNFNGSDIPLNKGGQDCVVTLQFSSPRFE